jgi:hypothetical protein
MSMVLELDVRPVLPTISAPTLVIHRAGDEYVPPEHGRYLAEHIPSARYVELPGRDHHYFFGDADGLLDEVQEFLTGVRPSGEPDRVLATVLFTDVVSSTGRAAEVGDRRWHDVLNDLDDLLHRQVERSAGSWSRGPATARSPRSTDLRARFNVRARSPSPFEAWISRFAAASTPASWSSFAAMSAGSR